jgi:non-ribosomal peptide synthetase component E (peptide arylation enzyme)
MQLVMTLPLVDLSLPANVQQVFSMINGIVNFQFFDTTKLDEMVLDFNRNETNPYSDAFDLQDIF